jgi:hypothetical protein
MPISIKYVIIKKFMCNFTKPFHYLYSIIFFFSINVRKINFGKEMIYLNVAPLFN